MREQGHLHEDVLATAVEANAVHFTDEQKVTLRDAFFEAEVALLKRIASEAQAPTDFDSPRKLGALVAALQGVRSMAAQSPMHLWAASRGGWMGFAPHTGEFFDPEFEE